MVVPHEFVRALGGGSSVFFFPEAVGRGEDGNVTAGLFAA
jgi:hypothetical protein